MKKRILKYGIATTFLAVTAITSTCLIASCSSTSNKFEGVTSQPLSSFNYKEIRDNQKVTSEEFLNNFNSTQGIKTNLNLLKLSSDIWEYVKDSLKQDKQDNSITIFLKRKTQPNLYSLKIFNFYNNSQNTNSALELLPNKLTTNNTNNISNVSNFQYPNFNNINLSEFVSNGMYLLSAKEEGLQNPQIISRKTDYSNNLAKAVSLDLDAYTRELLINEFDPNKIILSPNCTFYNKNINVNPDKTISGNLIIQIKNTYNKIINFNFFNTPIQLAPNDYVTIKLNLNNSNFDLTINNLNKNIYLGSTINNVEVNIQKNNEEQITSIQNAKIDILKSAYLHNTLSGVNAGNDLFGNLTELNKDLSSLDKTYFEDTLKKDSTSEFKSIQTGIVSGISILEKFNNVDVTLQQVLTSIGQDVYNLLNNFNIDPNILNIIKNLLSPIPVSELLYNIMPNIVNILQNAYNKTQNSAIKYILGFIEENLGSKDLQGYKNFVKDLPNIKDTIKMFIQAISTSPDAVTFILDIVDKLSNDQNIIAFLADNYNLIISIVTNVLDKNNPTTSLIINILNTLSNLQINNTNTNILKAKFWNIVTNYNDPANNISTNAKQIFIEILTQVINFLQTSNTNQQFNLVINILNVFKGVLANSHLTNFTPTSLVSALNSLLNPEPNLTLKDYFTNNFIIEFPTTNNLVYDAKTQTLNGDFIYEMKFNRDLTWNAQPLKDVFYNDALNLFKTYASYWYSQTDPKVQTDPIFANVINSLSKLIGTALVPQRPTINKIPGAFLGSTVRTLKKALLLLIDTNSSTQLSPDQYLAKNKEAFRLLFSVDLNNIPNLVWDAIGNFVKLPFPLKTVAKLSLVIDTPANIEKTFARYWSLLFGNGTIKLTANEGFKTTWSYIDSKAFPHVNENGEVSWEAVYSWHRDLSGLKGLFSQIDIVNVILGLTNVSTQGINYKRRWTYNNPIPNATKIPNYVDNVVYGQYKALFNHGDVAINNQVFDYLTTNGTKVTEQLKQELNKIIEVQYPDPNNKTVLEPYYQISHNTTNNQFTIEIYFPTKLIITEKTNQNLQNKNISFNNYYSFNLVKTAQ